MSKQFHLIGIRISYDYKKYSHLASSNKLDDFKEVVSPHYLEEMFTKFEANPSLEFAMTVVKENPKGVSKVLAIVYANSWQRAKWLW